MSYIKQKIEAGRTPLGFIDRLLEFILIITIALMVGIVAWEVFARQVFKCSAAWASEAARFLQVFVALIGGSYCVKKGAHLGIDAFVRILPPRWKKASDIFVSIIILVFSVLILIWGGIIFIQTVGEQRASAIPIKFKYLYLLFPISGFLNSIFTIERIYLVFKEGGEEKDA